MRFKHKQSQVPEVNLVPMLDVLMTVLTFFIVVSMTLALEQGVQVDLPGRSDQTPPTATDPPAMLLVKLAQTGLTLDTQPIKAEELQTRMKAFLQKHPKGIVVLQAEPQVPYEQVIQQLAAMKAIGGKQVSLAID